MMNELTERQKTILSVIVTLYTQTVSPVGSKVIADRYLKHTSSATVRNEMAGLEQMGYINHPHTSAGRVPTDKGYRYYVDSLNESRGVDSAEAGLIAREFRQQVKSIEELIERTSKVLSFLTEQAGVVVYPTGAELALKRLQLIPHARHHLLVVLVATTGIVQSKIVDLEEEIPEEDLNRLSQFLNTELSGRLFVDIPAYLSLRFSDMQDAAVRKFQFVRDFIQNVFKSSGERKVYVDGSRFVLKQPEFRSDARKTRLFFRALENKEEFLNVFDEPLEPGEVRVRIGRENLQEEIWDCALVTARYHAQNRPLGALGVLGPKRMPYGRVISLVEHISRRLSDAFEELA